MARSENFIWSKPIVTISEPITIERCSGFQQPLEPLVLWAIVPRADSSRPSSWATITPPAEFSMSSARHDLVEAAVVPTG